MTANTEASKAFTLIAGPRKNTAKRKTGCYHIHANIYNVFGSGYVGQSIILGNRVREHANLCFSTTSNYITSLQNEAKVTLYLVPASYNLPLDIAMFLTILEQFLFFALQPSVNISLVTTLGLISSNKEQWGTTENLG